MTKSLSDIVLGAIPIDDQARISNAIVALAKGFCAGFSTGSTKTTLTLDDFIHINSGDVDVVVPEAAAANKGKIYIIQFTNATCSATDIVDDKTSPTSIVAAAQITQYDIFILISDGAAWKVIGIAGAAIA